MVSTFWTPGISMKVALTRSMTSWVRSSEAPGGSSALTKKYPSSSPGTNPLGIAENPRNMRTSMPA